MPNFDLHIPNRFSNGFCIYSIISLKKSTGIGLMALRHEKVSVIEARVGDCSERNEANIRLNNGSGVRRPIIGF